MNGQHSRLDRLEATLQSAPCATCAAWPALVVQTDDAEPDHPTTCPQCGRAASQVVRITSRDDGPQ